MFSFVVLTQYRKGVLLDLRCANPAVLQVCVRQQYGAHLRSQHTILDECDGILAVLGADEGCIRMYDVRNTRSSAATVFEPPTHISNLILGRKLIAACSDTGKAFGVSGPLIWCSSFAD